MYEEYEEYREDFDDEQEEKEIIPSWTEEYLNTLGMSMSDFM